MSSLLEAFRSAYKNLQLLPLLTREDLDSFWIDYGGEVIARLQLLVDNCTPGNDKIIFAGHRGCGKSTLLGRLTRMLEQRQQNPYFVVFFSISDMIEMSDVNHINILFAIAVQLMDKAEDPVAKIKIKPEIKRSFYQWFAEQVRTLVLGE